MADPLTHEKVPRHTVLTPAQTRMLLKRLALEPERLPAIFINDPVIVALSETNEVNVGDIIQIDRNSVTSGSKPYWRLVIPPEESDA